MGEMGLLLHVWAIDLVGALVRVVRDGCKGGQTNGRGGKGNHECIKSKVLQYTA